MARSQKPFKIRAGTKKVKFPMMRLDYMAQFRELMELEVTHEYFTDGVFPPGTFRITPTESTLILLQQNTLQFRSTVSGCMLGYGYTDNYSPLKRLEEPLVLSFMIELNDNNFLNYTDLPFVIEESRIFYFHNKELEKEDSAHKNLSDDRFVGDDDRIEVSHPRFVYQFEEPQYGDVEIQVMDAADEVVFEEILIDGAMACDINLFDYPEGKYTLYIDGLPEKSFYTYSGLKPLFGVMDILIDPNEFGDYSFFDDEELVQQKYTLNFKARSVRWNYLLVEQGREAMHKDPEIYDSVKKNDYVPMLFTTAENVEMDGREVRSIWTDSPIPMQQRQDQKFRLKTKRGKSGVEWIQPLPCAMVNGNLKVNLSDPDEVYSELIVYL